MIDKIGFSRGVHCAVSLDNFVIIFGGRLLNLASRQIFPISTREIWAYNVYTSEWKKYVTPYSKDAPVPFIWAVAVVIHGVIYTFGGFDTQNFDQTNALWTLNRTREYFTWTFIEPKCKEESPSPRMGHTGWEYAGQLWVFGGLGHSQGGYLNDHGNFVGMSSNVANNQLLSYDPTAQKWTNPQSYGNVPSPRLGHASTIINNKVWVFGGCKSTQVMIDDTIFELAMHSLTWTQLQTGQLCPQVRASCTLTALAGEKLVLHGGFGDPDRFSDTWIMDLSSHSWKLYTSQKDHDRWYHTGSLGPNNDVIILCGFKKQSDDEVYSNTFHVMLEPRCLQQLALKLICKHQDQLPWKLLPAKLISKLGISVKERAP